MEQTPGAFANLFTVWGVPSGLSRGSDQSPVPGETNQHHCREVHCHHYGHPPSSEGVFSSSEAGAGIREEPSFGERATVMGRSGCSSGMYVQYNPAYIGFTPDEFARVCSQYCMHSLPSGWFGVPAEWFWVVLGPWFWVPCLQNRLSSSQTVLSSWMKLFQGQSNFIGNPHKI